MITFRKRSIGSTRRNVLAVAVGAALVTLPSTAGAQQADTGEPIVEASRQVTTSIDPVRLHVSPQIAVHPTDPSTAALVVGDARNGGCALHVTRDGGLSWSTAIPNLLPEGTDFCIHRNFGPYATPAFASDGTLYVGMSGSSVVEGHPNGPIDALVARVSDLRTHETFVVAESTEFEFDPADYELSGPDAPGKQTGDTQHRYNSLAVDPTDPNKVYTGWRWGVGGLEGVPFGAIPVKSMIAVSSDGGRTWSEPIDVAQSFEGEAEIFGSDVPMLAVGPDGTVYAITKERPKSAGDERPPSRLLMFKSTDGGETWATSVIHQGAPYITNPAATVDPTNGNLYVTWEMRGDAEENPAEVYFMGSTDGGENWSEPVNITDDDPGEGYNQYFPGISVAPNGRIDVAWHDFRNDPFFTPGEAGSMGTTEGERFWDVYYAYSQDGGGTWSQNIRVTDRWIDGDVGVTFNNNDLIAPIGMASTDYGVYVTWPDSRAGGPEMQAEDAYVTRIRFEASPGTAATASDSRALWSVLGAGLALAAGGLVLLVGTRLARGGRPEAVPQPVQDR